MVIILGTGCGLSFSPLLSDDTEAIAEATPSTTPIFEASTTYAIALGGVAPGRDTLVIADKVADTVATITFTSEDDTIVGLLPRPGFADFTSGRGAVLIPQASGSTRIRYTLNGVEQPNRFGVVVPPQELVQVLMGEARGQILSEATVSNGVVALTSRSRTAEALAAVIRNRVALISQRSEPSLFAADKATFYANPPATSYAAVIEAQTMHLYQFSPVHPDDGSHTVYTNASARAFLAPTEQLAYDQSVLTAAGIFDGSIADPTGGAFAFRTPSSIEAECLTAAADVPTISSIPTGCGPGDANFPALAPVQILIHPDIARLSDGFPAFVFYRERATGAAAVTKVP